MKKVIASVIAALAITCAVVALTASPASASSTKCAWYGVGIRYGVRNGSFCTTVNGSGTYVQTVTGNFGTTLYGVDKVCNPNIKVDVYDRYGRWITWRNGATRFGCYPWAANSVPAISVWWDFPAARCGYIKVTLQSYGGYVAENRHTVSC